MGVICLISEFCQCPVSESAGPEPSVAFGRSGGLLHQSLQPGRHWAGCLQAVRAGRAVVPGKRAAGGDQHVLGRGDTFGAELLTLGASVVAVNHKIHTRGGRGSGFAASRVYFVHAFTAAPGDLVAGRGSQVRLLCTPGGGCSNREELRELLSLNCPALQCPERWSMPGALFLSPECLIHLLLPVPGSFLSMNMHGRGISSVVMARSPHRHGYSSSVCPVLSGVFPRESSCLTTS